MVKSDAEISAARRSVIWFGSGSRWLDAAWARFEVHHVRSSEAVIRALNGDLAYCVVFDIDFEVDGLVDFIAMLRRKWPYVGLLSLVDAERRRPTGELALFDEYVLTNVDVDRFEQAVLGLTDRALRHPERLVADTPLSPDSTHLNNRMRHLEGLVQAAFSIPARITENDILGNLREVGQVAVDADDVAVLLVSQNFSVLSDALKLGTPGKYLEVCQAHLTALAPDQREVFLADEVLLRERVPGMNAESTRVREAKAADAWSYMRLPLTIDQRLVGFVALFSASPGQFSGAHLQLARLFAAQIATALRNMRLYFRLNRVERRQRAVSRVAFLIAEDVELDAVLSRITEEATRLVKADLGAVLLTQSDQSLVVKAGYGAIPSGEIGKRIEPGAGQVGLVALTGQPSVVKDYEHWEHAIPDAVDLMRNKTLFAVPLSYRGRVLGVLQMITGRMIDAEAREAQDALMMLAPQAATAIVKAQLHDTVRQDRQQLRAILDHTAAAVVVCDARGEIMMINPELRQVVQRLGFRADDLIGRNVQDVAREFMPGRPVTPDGFRHVLEINLGEIGEYVVNIAPIVGPDGHVERYVAVGQEVSELRRLDRLRSDLIHILSHDLRNPLGLARGSIDLIDEPDLPPEQRQQLKEMIVNALERMEQLISDVVDLEMTESVGEQTALPYELDKMTRQVVQRSQDKANRASVTLRYHQESIPPGKLRGHAMLVGQAIDNLVTNAIKYTPEGGEINVSLSVEDDMAVIEVRDTGYGIPAESLPRVFEQFYRVNDKRTRNIPGTGLGLSLVKKIAEAHGGSVSVESTVDVGSTFRMCLPLETPLHAPEATRQITRVDLSASFANGTADFDSGALSDFPDYPDD